MCRLYGFYISYGLSGWVLLLKLVLPQACNGAELCPGQRQQHPGHDERTSVFPGLLWPWFQSRLCIRDLSGCWEVRLFIMKTSWNHVKHKSFERKCQHFPFWESGFAAVVLHVLVALLKVWRLLLEVFKYYKSLVKWIQSKSITKPLKSKEVFLSCSSDLRSDSWLCDDKMSDPSAEVDSVDTFYLTVLKGVWLRVFKGFYLLFLL